MSAPLWMLAATLAPATLAPAAPAPAAAPAATAPAAAPAVTADRDKAAAGDRVLVRLAAWPSGMVTIEVCATSGDAVGCAVDSAVQTYVPRTGKGGATLTVTAPPGACPCQIRATSLDRATVATTPITIAGTPGSGPAAGAPAPAPRLLAATMDGGTSWRARLGWPGRRTLTLRLRNDAAVPAPVTLALTVGRGTDPTGFVPVPPVPDLAPGEERAIAVPVELPRPAIGEYTIEAQVTSAGRTSRVVATTASYPWPVPAVLAVATLLLAWRVRRASVQRYQEHVIDPG